MKHLLDFICHAAQYSRLQLSYSVIAGNVFGEWAVDEPVEERHILATVGQSLTVENQWMP